MSKRSPRRADFGNPLFRNFYFFAYGVRFSTGKPPTTRAQGSRVARFFVFRLITQIALITQPTHACARIIQCRVRRWIHECAVVLCFSTKESSDDLRLYNKDNLTITDLLVVFVTIISKFSSGNHMQFNEGWFVQIMPIVVVSRHFKGRANIRQKLRL